MQIIFKDLLKKKPLSLRHLYVELRDGRFYHNKSRTNIMLFYDIWNDKNQTVNNKTAAPIDEINKLSRQVNDLRTFLTDKFTNDKAAGKITTDWLKKTLQDNTAYEHPDNSFDSLFDRFLHEKEISDVRKKRYEVVRRLMLRYELYVRYARKGQQNYSVNVKTFTKEDLEDFHQFVLDEHEIYEKYPDIYASLPEKRKPTERGVNTMHSLFACLKAFFTWAENKGFVPSSPFRDFSFEAENYGTPYFLSLDELKTLYDSDLSKKPMQEKQRDIFVFQCNIGARVSDMMRLTRDNISGDILTYIPAKTKKYRIESVSVPLTATAKEILKKYSDLPGNALLPFISQQNYNDNLKVIFKNAGLTRKVPVMNSVTGEETYIPLYDLASSHLARRTFVGNLYKKVKDPTIIGSMSGHAPGSRSFLRYRNIDEDIQKETIKHLEF